MLVDWVELRFSSPALVLNCKSWMQVVTASHDKTVRLWDLRMGKTLATLTHHKKAVRALTASPTEHTFASGATRSAPHLDPQFGPTSSSVLTHGSRCYCRRC